MKPLPLFLFLGIELVYTAQIYDEYSMFEKRDRQTCRGDRDCSSNSYCFDWGKIKERISELKLFIYFKVKDLLLVFVCLRVMMVMHVSITQDVYQIIAISGVVKVYRKGKM